jgi:transmembrane sensor
MQPSSIMQQRTDPVLETATDWLLRLEAAPEDAALRANAEAWRCAAPAHAQALDQAQRALRYIAQVPPALAHQWDASARPEPRRQAKLTWAARAGLAALAACLVLLFLPGLLLRWHADYVTGVGEVRELALADGTVVTLGPRSAVAIDYDSAHRAVALLAGNALFEVARDPGRVFQVAAEGVEVTVTGTVFDVRLGDDAVTVAVREGAVAVRYGSVHPEARLTPGDQLTIDLASGEWRPQRLDPADIALWRDGKLFVDGATVAEVVEELGRYQSGWIVIADDALAQRRVTGLYDLADPERAMRALVRPYGGSVRAVTPLLHVLSAP